MELKRMQFTGSVWRPPYEANSLLLQATIGCSHHKCKFCSLYKDTQFRVASREEVERNLEIAQLYQPKARRVFLTGANPFVLSFEKLKILATLIKIYLPEVQNIGCFARISDIKRKTIEQLMELRQLGYDRISIGTESGDDITLSQMNKGYSVMDIVEQCRKLENAGIEYNFTYLIGLAGKGQGERNAINTADTFSLLHPYIINVLSLTVFPDTVLYEEIGTGTFVEASEYERIEEMEMFIERFQPSNCVHLLANTVSNPIPFIGVLPKERERILKEIQSIKNNFREEDLRDYRKRIKSL